MADAVSSSDCTGLMVSGPGFEDELGHYSQVYKIWGRCRRRVF